MPGEHQQRPVEYRDQQGRVWSASEVAQLRVVSPSVDGPNLCLVIKFEREGEERFARWIGGEEWRLLHSLQRLFAEAEPAEPETAVETQTPKPAQPAHVEIPAAQVTGVAHAPPEPVALWLQLVATMGPDELAAIEERTSADWDRASLAALRGAIRHRWRQLAGD
jgi:hypothetical protein